jgi:hypothetical protein
MQSPVFSATEPSTILDIRPSGDSSVTNINGSSDQKAGTRSHCTLSGTTCCCYQKSSTLHGVRISTDTI